MYNITIYSLYINTYPLLLNYMFVYGTHMFGLKRIFGLFSWPLFRVELGAVAEPPCHPAGHRGPHSHWIDGNIWVWK